MASKTLPPVEKSHDVHSISKLCLYRRDKSKAACVVCTDSRLGGPECSPHDPQYVTTSQKIKQLIANCIQSLGGMTMLELSGPVQ